MMNQALNAALTLAWQGMSGIFIVMAVIALVVYGFSKFASLGKKGE